MSSHRAAAILIENCALALVECHCANRPHKAREMIDLNLRARAEGWPAEPLTWSKEECD